jgi:hypothetical protein
MLYRRLLDWAITRVIQSELRVGRDLHDGHWWRGWRYNRTFEGGEIGRRIGGMWHSAGDDGQPSCCQRSWSTGSALRPPISGSSGWRVTIAHAADVARAIQFCAE